MNKQILISHRGNIVKRNPKRENSPDYIDEALSKGFYVEIDLRWNDGNFWLGHDRPQYKIDIIFLLNTRLFIHCKDLQSYERLCVFGTLMNVDISALNIFIHDQDHALTTSGFIITAPGTEINVLSIAMMPEMALGWDVSQAAGICSDEIIKYK